MQRNYRSKIDLLIAGPLLSILAVLLTWAIIAGMWFFFALAVLLLALAAYIYFRTHYLITDKILEIEGGFFFHKEIYIRSIKRIRRTKNLHASPALSPDRLEIFYNRYESITISPENRKRFIDELIRLNPSIAIL